jgi:hypothetical protein
VKKLNKHSFLIMIFYFGSISLINFSSIAKADDVYPSYPTKEVAKKYLDKNCDGVMNKFKLSSDSRPKLLNSCLLFAIVAGDRKEINTFLEKGASTQSQWPINLAEHGKNSRDAIWPDAKGEVVDETGSLKENILALGYLMQPTLQKYAAEEGSTETMKKLDRLASAAKKRVIEEKGKEKSMTEELVEIPPHGLGFNALTLAITLNDFDTINALLKKNPELANYRDGFYRLPIVYATSLGNSRMVERLLQEKENCINCSVAP